MAKEKINYNLVLRTLNETIELLEQENQQLKERINMTININRKNKELLSILDEIREQLKKIKPDLDFEPWSIYTINGDKLFDLSQILDKVGIYDLYSIKGIYDAF